MPWLNSKTCGHIHSRVRVCVLVRHGGFPGVYVSVVWNAALASNVKPSLDLSFAGAALEIIRVLQYVV